MRIFKSKLFLRSYNIFAHSSSLFLPNLTNILSSALVIRLLVPEWWGQITVLQLYMYLANQVCAWGNKDSLLKLFSDTPSNKNFLWMESFSSRLFLLIPVIIGTYFISTDIFSVIHLSCWIILRYFSQSFEVIILFSRKFLVNIFAELFSIFTVVFAIFVFKNYLTFHQLLLIITVSYFLKTMILTIYFSSYFRFNVSFIPNVKKLVHFLPFMIIGFSGVLQQKSDMMSIAWLSSKIEIAQYSVFSSFLFFMQSIPGLILGPYVKNLYRLPATSYIKIQRLFTLLGFVISTISIFIIFLIIKLVYQFDFPFIMYFFGFLNGLFTYFYMLKIFLMFKNQKQHHVMIINTASIILNFILCFVFIQILSLQGAVLANVITQFSIYLVYKYYLKNNLSISL